MFFFFFFSQLSLQNENEKRDSEFFEQVFETKDNIEKLARIPVFVKHQNVFHRT